MELTGELARQQKQMVANSILNRFLDMGSDFLREGDIESVKILLVDAHSQFRRFGIDIEKLLETGKV